jgi:hypothetical protein
MAAIGIALLLGGYGVGLTGYSLIRGYDMTLGSFWNPVHPGKWNTALYTGTSVFPDGKTQGTSKAASTPSKPLGTGKGATSGQAPPGAK